MKSFNAILNSFKEDTVMEFCELLSSVQAALEYADNHIKLFQQIEYRGGNESYIDEIVAKLKSVLRQHKLIDAETDEPIAERSDKLHKFTFYLILNTKSTFKWHLMEDPTVCHIVDTAPQLTKCMLFACIWGLKLTKFFCEFVAYAPMWFAVNFVEGAVESLKYCDVYDILANSEQILRAMYVNIARSDCRHSVRAEKVGILNRFYDVTLEFVREYLSIDAEKCGTWTKNRRYKYYGYVMKHTAEITLFGCNIHQQQPEYALPSAELNAYQIFAERESLTDLNVNEYSDAVAFMLKKMNIVHLNNLQHNLMNIDMNAFLYWVEVDLTEELTLQRAVGETVHALLELFNVNDCYHHDVTNSLKSISITPISVAERSAQWTIGEFITQLESLPRDDPDLGLWIDSFIGRGDLVLGNQECLDMLDSYTDILTSGNIRQLILYANNVHEKASVDDKLIEICLNSFDYLPESDILPLIRLAIDEQESHFSVFQTDDFDATLIEVFNKCQYSEDSKPFLKLLFQNPQLFYDKVFDEGIRSEQQMTHMMRILKATCSVAHNYVENNLKILIDDKCKTEEENVQRLIPRFIANLFFAKVIEPQVFITKILYEKYLIPAILAQNNVKIDLLMKVFWAISLKHSFGDLSPPILVMAAQVLQQCRWDLLKYTDEVESILVKTLEFINEVMKTYLPTAGEQDKAWILSKISTYHPLTRYYFQRLTLRPGQRVPTLDKFLEPRGFSAKSHTERIQFLCQILVRCTEKEISWLAKNNDLLDCFWEAFELICTIVSRSSLSQTNAINCFRHCFKSFFHVIKYNILPTARSSDDQIELLKNILNWIQCTQALTIYDELFLSAHPLMIQIVEAVANEQKYALIDEVKPIVDSLPECESKSLFSAKFDEILS